MSGHEVRIESRRGPAGKRLVEAALSLLAAPRVALYGMAARWIGEERALGWLSESAACWAGPLGVLCRAAVYRRVLRRVGRDVYIGYGTTFSKAQAELGDGVYIGRRCGIGWAAIGDGVRIADGAQLLSGAHQHAERGEAVVVKRIVIGRGAWIGAGAVVMSDVGEGAVVGAGAVVTRPVGAGQTVGGVPAKPLHDTPLKRAG